MVTSVDSAMSLLSSRPTGQDLATTASGAATEAVKALDDQIAAKSSPAWLRGSSLATDAWIANTNATDEASAVGGVTEAKASTDLGSATASSVMRSKKLSITNEDMLIDAIITFNQTLNTLPSLEKELQGYQADLHSATDDRMVEYLKQKIASVTNSISRAVSIISIAPGDIQDGFGELQRTRNISGVIYTRGSDGSFAFGQFSIGITIPNGPTVVTLSHDGSGVAIKNIYTDSGTQTQEIPLS
ncbi:hypothetical protein [Xanthobacter agilis]|jgi:hypothetical protein|uniref:Uncharacterized protein n=1 Tax=Xanthobacter agilis TaxID=47492 RepID=A0ABU0LBP6_XANAG|nr:hypothetical protein [Xanthobacter agilis]MDQ0504558.1 hypothetical protein [Xanthobacter agilis]